MEEFPGNSHKEKTEQQERERPKQDKIVKGVVKQRKPPWTRRVFGAFFADDANSVGRYILMDVLVPALKDTLADMVQQSIERTLYGRVSPHHRSHYGRSRQHPSPISYNRFSQSPAHSTWSRSEDRRDISPQARRRHDFDEILLATRVEAVNVLDRLSELCDKYAQVTVSDLYDLVGIEGTFADERWGWIDLRGASTRRVNGGYLLDLPSPRQLD